MAIELVVGVAVGGGVGWALDNALGTKPWLLIVFFFLGFAGGMLNLVRSAQRAQASRPAPGSGVAVRDEDDDR